MTDLEKIINWIKTFNGFDILSRFTVDYTDNIAPNGGIFPQGIVEISRKTDVLGDSETINQANFGIYCSFFKDTQDDIGATQNANWVCDFQKWVQSQSVKKLAPALGNDENFQEIIKAQNGTMFEVSDGVAIYMIQLSVVFKTIY